MNKEKLSKRKLTPLERQFVKNLTNYGILLILKDEKRSINELNELIRLQNERRKNVNV